MNITEAKKTIQQVQKIAVLTGAGHHHINIMSMMQLEI